MTSKIVYLITGANRGIGLGMTSSLLLRSNTTIVATVRSDTTPTDHLKALPVAEGSQLVVLTLSSASDTSAATLAASLPEHGITHIDTIIANAGTATTFEPALSTSLSSLRDDFEINTLGPVKIFQAIYPLLKKSSKPKFVLISSGLGSIESTNEWPTLSYGVSKVAGNFFTRKVHVEHDDIASLTISPGWVKTGNGQNFADSIGVREPPMPIELSVNGVLAQVDALEKSSPSSGSFVSYDGSTIPW